MDRETINRLRSASTDDVDTLDKLIARYKSMNRSLFPIVTYHINYLLVQGELL